jgi:hypothetical protein
MGEKHEVPARHDARPSNTGTSVHGIIGAV